MTQPVCLYVVKQHRDISCLDVVKREQECMKVQTRADSLGQGTGACRGTKVTEGQPFLLARIRMVVGCIWIVSPARRKISFG